MDKAETDLLAWMHFPIQHRAKQHSTRSLERPNGEIKRRREVIDIFSNEDAILCLIGAWLLGEDDECAVQRARCMTRETIAPVHDDPVVNLPPTGT